MMRAMWRPIFAILVLLLIAGVITLVVVLAKGRNKPGRQPYGQPQQWGQQYPQQPWGQQQQWGQAPQPPQQQWGQPQQPYPPQQGYGQPPQQ